MRYGGLNAMFLPTRKPIPESAAPQELIDRGLFKPAGGGRCRHCSWSTAKKGFSARQALRAHLKKHRNESRAWGRPLVMQFLVVMTVLSLAVASWAGVDLPPEFGAHLSLVSLPDPHTGWTTMGVSSALAVISLTLLLWGSARYGGRTPIRVQATLVVLGTLIGIWAAVGIWGIVETDMEWTMQVPVWIMLGLTPAVAAKVGWGWLMVKRRQVRFTDYVTFVEPTNKAASRQIAEWGHRKKARDPRADQSIIRRCLACRSPVRIASNQRSSQCGSCGAMVPFN